MLSFNMDRDGFPAVDIPNIHFLKCKVIFTTKFNLGSHYNQYLRQQWLNQAYLYLWSYMFIPFQRYGDIILGVKCYNYLIEYFTFILSELFISFMYCFSFLRWTVNIFIKDKVSDKRKAKGDISVGNSLSIIYLNMGSN